MQNFVLTNTANCGIIEKTKGVIFMKKMLAIICSLVYAMLVLTSCSSQTSEIGFDNPDKWGCKLIEIEWIDENSSYIAEDNEGEFVITYGAHIFELYAKEGQISYYILKNDSIRGNGTAAYNVLDNDLISVSSQDEGSGMIRITDRTKEKNIDILGISRSGDYDSDEKYIPYSFIDESKTPVFFKKGDYYDYYKLYLK